MTIAKPPKSAANAFQMKRFRRENGMSAHCCGENPIAHTNAENPGIKEEEASARTVLE
jgi:hypothetical protein